MKLTQDAGELKIHYNLLMHDCLKAHNEKMRRDNEFEYFSRKISRMVKYSKIDSVIYLSYGQKVYEVYKIKEKANTYKVMLNKRAICSEYWGTIDHLRIDIVFDELEKK